MKTGSKYYGFKNWDENRVKRFREKEPENLGMKTWTHHLGSIWHHSKLLEVHYSPNPFLVWDFYAVSYSKPTLIVFESVSLMRENLKGSRENLKIQNPTYRPMSSRDQLEAEKSRNLPKNLRKPSRTYQSQHQQPDLRQVVGLRNTLTCCVLPRQSYGKL